jgi:hypothetical protein
MNRSIVCKIANNLSRELGRSNAFKKSWNIVKSGAVSLSVAGVTFGNRQEALKRLARYDANNVWTFLVPEPSNPYDQHAVSVMVGVQNGRGLYRLGYIPRSHTGIIRALPQSVKYPIKILQGDIYGAKIFVTI